MLSEKGDISEDFIKRLHGKVTEGLGRYKGDQFKASYDEYDPNFIEGDYRIDQRYIQGTDFIPPSPEEIKTQMKKLMDFYIKNKYKMHPLELTSEFHQRFEKIHPFCDGNGRVGRLLMNFILNQSGYPMIDISINDRERYIISLAAETPKELCYFLYSKLKSYIKNLFKSKGSA